MGKLVASCQCGLVSNTSPRNTEDLGFISLVEANVPKFVPCAHKSAKQFGFSFAYDASKVWHKLMASALPCFFCHSQDYCKPN